MKGEIKFIKKQIFGGFSREDTVSYVAKIAAERNEEREANLKAKDEISTLSSEIERLRLELDERKSTIDKLEDHIAQSIIIKVVADKDTVINEKYAEGITSRAADGSLSRGHAQIDEIDDDIPEFKYDPDWYKKYEGEAKKKIALKLQQKEETTQKVRVKRN